MPVATSSARFGTPAHDELRAIAIAPGGELLVAGYTGGTKTATGDITGTRAVVLEYARDLSFLSQRGVFNTPGSDAFESIAIAPDTGAVWLAARTDGVHPTLPPRGDHDAVIGELTGAGFVPLARGFEATPEYPSRVAVGSGGLLAVAGFEHRAASDATMTTNPFLGVYATARGGVTPLWYSTRRLDAHERYTGVAVAGSAIVVAGAIANGEQQGTFVAARDSDAGHAWLRPLSHLGTDSIAAVRILADGDVLWTGTTTAALGGDPLGGTDILVGRLDGATGTSRWITRHGTAQDDHVTDMAIDGTGRIVLVAETAAVTGGVRSEADVLLLRLDRDGKSVVQEQWSSPGHDVASSVAVDACGTAVIAGTTDGDLAGTPHGGRDGFVLVSGADW